MSSRNPTPRVKRRLNEAFKPALVRQADAIPEQVPANAHLARMDSGMLPNPRSTHRALTLDTLLKRLQSPVSGNIEETA